MAKTQKRKLLFLGGFFTDDIKKIIYKNSKYSIQNAANNFQWGVINGLNFWLKEDLSLISVPFLGSFPKHFSRFLIPYDRAIGPNQNDISSIGFINLPLIKRWVSVLLLKRALFSWSDSMKNDEKIVIVYSLNIVLLKALKALKSRENSVKICIIVPDLPENPGDCSFIRKLVLKYYEVGVLYNLTSVADFFILLTESMSQKINVRNKPWIRLEGLINVSEEEANSLEVKEKISTVLYCGTFEERYGILNLIKAIELITNENIRFWFCGSGGDAEMALKKFSENDLRVTFYGQLDKFEVFSLQSRATLLINPRLTKGEYNKYSFPSKLIEYMYSGTPALIYPLPGIPQEYLANCYVLYDESVDALASEIVNICSKPQEELCEKGQAAKAFIVNNKSSTAQTQRILNMLLEN